MSTVILRGEEAIHYAKVHGLKLCTDKTPEHPARADLSVDEARQIQDAGPGHIWVETKAGVNSGEAVPHLAHVDGE